MAARRFFSAWSGVLAVFLAGCAGPIGVYHNIEGGAIAQSRQAPPGADLPYPNLADVPPAPKPAPAGEAASISARARSTQTGVSPPSPAALAGLQLPSGPPPLPDVPGLNLPATPTPVPSPLPPPPPAPPPEHSTAPVAIAFPPHSAILPYAGKAAIAAFVAQRNDGARVRAMGFGDGSLPLGLARARRLADALTAAGVPPRKIELAAEKSGSGGFVQLVY